MLQRKNEEEIPQQMPEQTPLIAPQQMSEYEMMAMAQQEQLLREAIANTVDQAFVQEAGRTLQKYKEGKANLDRKTIENEQWYKLRHWQELRQSNRDKEIEPTSAWCLNIILNKHADAMDNYPSINVLPREQGDKGQAMMLTKILPLVIEQNKFKRTYSKVNTQKFKQGTGIYGVFWDGSKLNGLGDISIKPINLLNIYYEPGIEDIQDSRNLFILELVDNDILKEQYPQIEGDLGNAWDIKQYVHDDHVDLTEKSIVVDMYYKKMNSSGKQVLHLLKFVNDKILFATENELEYAERGWYDHGLYPVVFDVQFEMEGSPAGFGYIDIARSPQEFIDRGNQAFLENMFANASPRYFSAQDGNINEEEYMDYRKKIVHVAGGRVDDTSIRPIEGKPLNPVYVNYLQSKIDEMKETCGNRDVSTGGSTQGVTAASAIAAMQESGSKLSRDSTSNSYEVFTDVCLMCIELIRQFYDVPRQFRIVGQHGMEQFVMYDNTGIVPQPQMGVPGLQLDDRTPLFDITVSPQKASPYVKMAQNELAIQFFQLGFFNPQMAEQALICLEMMDFDGKEEIMQKIQQNSMLMQQMMMMAQMLDQLTGGQMQYAGNVAMQFGMAPPQGAEPVEITDGEPEESSVTANARERVANSTAPR